jgi:hypothetical protein
MLPVDVRRARWIHAIRGLGTAIRADYQAQQPECSRGQRVELDAANLAIIVYEVSPDDRRWTAGELAPVFPDDTPIQVYIALNHGIGGKERLKARASCRA